MATCVLMNISFTILIIHHIYWSGIKCWWPCYVSTQDFVIPNMTHRVWHFNFYISEARRGLQLVASRALPCPTLTSSSSTSPFLFVFSLPQAPSSHILVPTITEPLLILPWPYRDQNSSSNLPWDDRGSWQHSCRSWSRTRSISRSWRVSWRTTSPMFPKRQPQWRLLLRHFTGVCVAEPGVAALCLASIWGFTDMEFVTTQAWIILQTVAPTNTARFWDHDENDKQCLHIYMTCDVGHI